MPASRWTRFYMGKNNSTERVKTLSNNMIFIDTGFIIAFFNKKDKHYREAREIIMRILEDFPHMRFIYSDYIFDEFITLMKKEKIVIEKTKRAGENILKSKIWKMFQIDCNIFSKTWEMIKQYDDKGWSFTDASSFALMEELGIRHYLAYDRHFSQYE